MPATPIDKRSTSRSRAICSPAWLLCGISSVPGELKLGGSVLSFTAHGTGSAWDWQLKKLERRSGASEFMNILKDGGHAVLFREPVIGIRSRSPWYYFSGGLVLQIRQQTYKVSFGQPASSSISQNEVQTIRTMRRVGRQWIRALDLE